MAWFKNPNDILERYVIIKLHHDQKYTDRVCHFPQIELALEDMFDICFNCSKKWSYRDIEVEIKEKNGVVIQAKGICSDCKEQTKLTFGIDEKKVQELRDRWTI